MGIVDWQLAARIALGLAGEGPAWDGDEAELRAESDRAGRLVVRYTKLRARGGIPPAELIDRAGWARINLDTFRSMSAGIEEKLAERMREAGREGGFGERIAATAAGAEVGLALGYLAQRVIGQYDVALIGPARAPRLLFVGANLSAARERLGVDRDLFLRWIALHEATHAVQFAGVEWLRPHLGRIATELFEQAAVEVKPLDVLGKLVRTDPRELIRTVSNGELAHLFWTEPQRELVDRLLAAMTVVEGYAEHVMDAVGESLDPRYAELRAALERDRERRGRLDALISKLLGLDMKMAQYRRGRAFCDTVAAETGIKGLNLVWRSPEHLPSQSELGAPAEWIERTGARRPGRLRGFLRGRPAPAAA